MANNVDVDILKNKIDKINAYMLAMKQMNFDIKREMIDEIKKVQHCVNQTKRETEADVKDLREQIKTNAQSIERLCSDKSNGNACIKNDLKILKSELNCISDDLVSEVDNCKFEKEIEKTTLLLKRVNKIEKENVTVTKQSSPQTQIQMDHRRRITPRQDSHKSAT